MTITPSRSDYWRAGAQQCELWAPAVGDRVRVIWTGLVADATAEQHRANVTSAMVAIVAHERALEAARYVVKNRDDAAKRLDALLQLGDPIPQLDAQWWIARKFRNKVEHMWTWLEEDDGFAGLRVTHQEVRLSGIPVGFSLIAAAAWSAALPYWARALLEDPVDDDTAGSKPDPVDKTEAPDWLKK